MKVRARLTRKRRRFSEPHTNAPAAASALPHVCTVASTRAESPASATQPLPRGPQYADRVRLIDDQFRGVTFCERGKIGERRAVAIHAENAFDHDHACSGNGRVAAKFILQER